ncbi:MAG: menaquinol oxidoreductase [Desulfuromonadaceae bacterium]
MTNQEISPESSPADQRTALVESIRTLHARSYRGIWAIVAFACASVPVMLSEQIIPPLTPEIKKLLGTPPSSNMISALLVVYAFSAILLVLGRITNASPKIVSFSHIGYLACFYAFYYFSGVLSENFWAVLATGMTILSLESYHIWSLNIAKIREEEEALALLERRMKN